MEGYEYKELKSYKGYEIYRGWKVDFDGDKVPNSTFYVVGDDDDWFEENFSTLQEAKKFIDTL